jgi:ribosomal protein L11 methyltransferase
MRSEHQTSALSPRRKGKRGKETRGLVALWEVRVLTNPEAEDAVTHLVYEAAGVPPTSYLDLRSGRTRVAAYMNFDPRGRPELIRNLRQRLGALRDFGIAPNPGRVSIHPVPHENWAESWKRHFKPIEIARALLLKPSWSRRKPKTGQRVLVLNPGLSFGTGHHPTTEFCLRQIVKERSTAVAQSLLDIGTGSGILAIAAAKLGYSPVHAFDYDPDSVRVAKSNAGTNRVHQKVRITQEDITKLPLRAQRNYAVVCANLIAPLLIAERRRIINRLAPGGVLILAGILNTEFRHVESAYKEAGLALTTTRTAGEWQSGAFRSPP